MARHDDDHRVVPELERKLTLQFAAVLSEGYGLSATRAYETRPQREPTFRYAHALHAFHDLMTREGDEGYQTGAWVFANGMDDAHAPRAVRSHALTKLARAIFTASNEPRRDPRESEVFHFGRFANELIETFPEMHVAWMEDMHVGDDAHDLPRQPTAVIRGVLLSPYLDQHRAVRFWELSLVSERFPDRVFSDPCPPDDGDIFTAFQIRRFAVLFSAAPPDAVRKFAAHMRDHAVTRLVREWDAENRRSLIEPRPADPVVRRRTLDYIVGNIGDADRRAMVAEIFGTRPTAA